MKYIVATFYRYVEIADPEVVRDSIKGFCQSNGILGRILIGEEGINGAICAGAKDMRHFKLWLEEDHRFFSMTYREQDVPRNVYHKLVVRVRKEIVAFGEKVDLKKKGRYVTPRELKEMYDKKEDFVIVDARNDYEFNVGHFKDAVKMPIKYFRDFAKESRKLEEFKDKKIIMYCTGGIRCEKATAYLNEHGFDDVRHLKGGIIDFNNEFPHTDFVGTNFVFDDRRIDSQDMLMNCEICDGESNNYINCHNLDCDRLFACCDDCKDKFRNCCCEGCMKSARQRKAAAKADRIGQVINFFAKPGVAQVKLESDLRSGQKIAVVGKTTSLQGIIAEDIRDNNDRQIDSASASEEITIKLPGKARRNDVVYLA